MEIVSKPGCCLPEGMSQETIRQIAGCLTIKSSLGNPKGIVPSITPPDDKSVPWVVLNEFGEPTGRTLRFINGAWQ